MGGEQGKYPVHLALHLTIQHDLGDLAAFGVKFGNLVGVEPGELFGVGLTQDAYTVVEVLDEIFQCFQIVSVFFLFSIAEDAVHHSFGILPDEGGSSPFEAGVEDRHHKRLSSFFSLQQYALVRFDAEGVIHQEGGKFFYSWIRHVSLLEVYFFIMTPLLYR